jgi:uncharacterized protein (DUF2235 family)
MGHCDVNGQRLVPNSLAQHREQSFRRRVADAIAIDERRAFFRQNRWSALPGPETLLCAGLTLDEAKRFLATTDETWIVPARQKDNS